MIYWLMCRMQENGARFKVSLPFKPYLYLHVKKEYIQVVIRSLSRLKRIEIYLKVGTYSTYRVTFCVPVRRISSNYKSLIIRIYMSYSIYMTTICFTYVDCWPHINTWNKLKLFRKESYSKKVEKNYNKYTLM